MSIFEAAQKGDTPTLRALIDSGAESNRLDEDERSALHWAAAGGHLEAVEYLSSLPGAKVNHQDGGGWTPLMSATSAGKVKVVRYLIGRYACEYKSDCSINAAHGMDYFMFTFLEVLTPIYAMNLEELHSIITKEEADILLVGVEEIVTILLQATTDINVQDRAGMTPLAKTAGAKTECLSIIHKLLNARARTNTVDVNGNTPLHLAGNGHHVVKFLADI